MKRNRLNLICTLVQKCADRYPTIRAFLLQSLDLRADPPRWRLNLDVLDRAMGDLVGFPKVSGTFAEPALFLSGEAIRVTIMESLALPSNVKET